MNIIVGQVMKNLLALFICLLASIGTRCVNGSPNNHLHGIGHISVTTDDLDLSTRFYTEVMGGMLMRELSYRFHGDEHYYLMFEKEISEARQQGIDPSDLGVPDISNNGTYQVSGNFVVFDNGLIQLQSFIRRDITDRQVPFEARESRTSPAFITAPHICFWVEDGVDFNHYIAELERKSMVNGFSKVKANRPVNVSTEEERQRIPEDQLGMTFTTGDFAGLSFGYFKGPSGEQLELYQFTNQSRYHMGKEYCQRHSVSSAFLASYNDNVSKQRAGVPGKLNGLIQFGIRTDDLQLSAAFYSDLLGGKIVDRPLQGRNIRGNAAYTMLFLKELFDARRLGVPPISLGIPDITDTGRGRLDHRFILFDNYVVEPLIYTDGPSLEDPPFNPRYNWSSPAFINNMAVAFQLDEHIDMAYYVKDLQARARVKGFQKVHLNLCPDSICTGALFPVGSPLEGYRYVYVKGPAGEQLVFTQFRGHAANVLKQALLEYGAISTAFDETNPWKNGRFQSFCSQYDDVILNSCERLVSSSLLFIVVISIIGAAIKNKI